MIDKDKALAMVVSAMLSGGLTVAMNTANTGGRLTAVENSLARIELRLDATFPQPAIARAPGAKEKQQ